MPPRFHTGPTQKSDLGPAISDPSPDEQSFPPPAPPMDAARFGNPAFDPEETLDEIDEASVPRQAAAYPPAFASDRATETANRLAEEGRAALRRQEMRSPLWPLITPGPSLLKPVPQPPTLAPVPR